MPTFDDFTSTSAAATEVWALLRDTNRFPDWWQGIATVEMSQPGGYTMYVDGYPDFPMPQLLDTSELDNRVTVSCTVSDLVFEWRLQTVPDGTRIDVHVDIPDAEAARLAAQRDIVAASLRSLAALAATRAG